MMRVSTVLCVGCMCICVRGGGGGLDAIQAVFVCMHGMPKVYSSTQAIIKGFMGSIGSVDGGGLALGGRGCRGCGIAF